MKTKVNKIPLVGPRGRQEILKKVEQLTKQNHLRIVTNSNPDTGGLSANLLYQLSLALEQGTIFDVTVVVPQTEEIQENQIRIIAERSNDPKIRTLFYIGANGTIKNFTLQEPTKGYGVLAKIEDQIGEYPALTYVVETFILREDNTDKMVCVDGFLLKITVDDADCITSVEITDEKAQAGTETIEISAEDAQNLVGTWAGY